MNDPATVVQELGSVAAKGEPIAVELGVQSTDLDAIKVSEQANEQPAIEQVSHSQPGGEKPQKDMEDAEMEQAADVPAIELQPEGGELQPEGGEPQQDTEGKFKIIVTISRV